MTGQYLTLAIEGVPSLVAAFVIAIPDGRLLDSFVRGDVDWQAEEVAHRFGDLYRASREGVKALRSRPAELEATIEAPEHLVLLTELHRDFVCASVFERRATLGLARLYNRRLLDRLGPLLPSAGRNDLPRGVQVIEFLNRHAPDPHTILWRISLRSRIPIQELLSPEKLDPERIRQLEEATCNILGLPSLNL